jgi:energy-coupling factor transport system permease protein
MLFIISLFFIKSLVVYLLILIAVSVIFFRIPFESLKKGWIPIGIFLFFTFFSNLLFQHGRILYHYGPVVVTEEGLMTAILRTARVFFMIAGAKILTATTKIESLIGALGNLFRPLERLGIPVNEFLLTMNLTMKSLPVLKDQIVKTYREKITDSNMRGFWNRARLISLFLVPLFVKSMHSPERFFEDDSKRKEKGNSFTDG